MKSLLKKTSDAVACQIKDDAFLKNTSLTIIPCGKVQFGHFQCNDAIALGHSLKKTPVEMGHQIAKRLSFNRLFSKVTVARRGYVNMILTDQAIAAHLNQMLGKTNLGIELPKRPDRLIIDYGGPNIAKPLHVGHVRSANIGEALKRLTRLVGHKATGDAHLGDWGFQMGLIFNEIQRNNPDLCYFNKTFISPYPSESPVSLEELESMYPLASKRAKHDNAVREAARQTTYDLQHGDPGLRQLWQHIVKISLNALKKNYTALGVEFDLWLGESDAQPYIPAMIEKMKAQGSALRNKGALVVDVYQESDTRYIPPLILQASNGASLYSTTDLATIQQRVDDFNPTHILYVVDKRQQEHFTQVFRAAKKTGIANPDLKLEHIAFGTMNGKDGRPFKTRAGGVMRLEELIGLVIQNAEKRMTDIGANKVYGEKEKKEIAKKIGIATLKFADLVNHYSKDYCFDLDKFSSFEGKTGPYIVYAAVRINSLLKKAQSRGLMGDGPIMEAESKEQRELFLKIAQFHEVLETSYEKRALSILCEYAYGLASSFNRFYYNHSILIEKNDGSRTSWLKTAALTGKILKLLLDVLGIEIPKKM